MHDKPKTPKPQNPKTPLRFEQNILKKKWRNSWDEGIHLAYFIQKLYKVLIVSFSNVSSDGSECSRLVVFVDLSLLNRGCSLFIGSVCIGNNVIVNCEDRSLWDLSNKAWKEDVGEEREEPNQKGFVVLVSSLVCLNGSPNDAKEVGREWSDCGQVHDHLEGLPGCSVA